MRCWAQYLLWLAIAVLGTGNLLSSCGQSGDLYLPDTAAEDPEPKRPQPHVP
jgi:predicted small lipoprotein YifL